MMLSVKSLEYLWAKPVWGLLSIFSSLCFPVACCSRTVAVFCCCFLLLMLMNGAVMVLMRKVTRACVYSLLVFFTILASSVLYSEMSFGATVKICKKIKQSEQVDHRQTKKSKKRVYCSLKPQLGEPGDFVEIKNQYNYIVAVGRIVKQQRSTTIIVLTQYDVKEGSMAGYPVMLRKNENQDFWTATTAPF